MATFDMLADQPSFTGTAFTAADVVTGAAAFDTHNAFTGDFMGLSLPEEVWGLNSMSPPVGTWTTKNDISFPGTNLERDLKNTRVRNGQPTPPLDEKSATDHLYGMETRSRKHHAQQASASPTSSKRRSPRDHRYLTAASSGGESDGPPDRAKREKFLERNRLAASKCRQKKKEHTQQLESRYKEQAEKKEELMAEIAQLRGEILHLKNEVLKHAQCGDEPIKLHLAQMVKRITDSDSVVGIPREQPREMVEKRAVDTSPSLRGDVTFGFDDPMHFDNPPADSLEQIRRDSEASLAFSADDSFEDLINV